MHRFTVYGLHIASDQAIPGLNPGRFESAPDLTVLYGAEPTWPEHLGQLRYEHPEKDETGEPLLSCTEWSGQRVRLEYTGRVRFFLDFSAATCWLTWPASTTRELASAYLLGPVLGYFLRLRGHVCLHASVVVLDGQGVGFAGLSGAGKSTMAAALAQVGAEVVTDDVACLVPKDDGIWVEPGYPLVRLWDESGPMLRIAPEDLKAVGWKKRCIPLDGGPYRFHPTPARLTQLFVLGGRRFMEPAARIRDLGGRETLELLVANTFVTYLLDRQMRAKEFETLGRLARSVRIRELTLNEDGSRLAEARGWLLPQLRA